MNLRVLYFASLRETVGINREQLDLSAQVRSVADLRTHLAERGGSWRVLERAGNLRCAVNQQMAAADTPLKDGDEVAFFPPVTGG